MRPAQARRPSAMPRVLASEFLDGLHLILVDRGALAVELLEFVEAGLFIELGLVHGLDLAPVVQRDHRWRGAASQYSEAESHQQGGDDPFGHGLSPCVQMGCLRSDRKSTRLNSSHVKIS